jgi:hypothetical protein
VEGHADLPTGSRSPVGAVFWAVVSAPTVSFVAIVYPIVARAIVVVTTRISIVTAVAAACVLAATKFLGAARSLGAAWFLARPIGTRALLFASAVDEVARRGLLGGSGRFVGELPCPFLQCLLRECVVCSRVAFSFGHLRAVARKMAMQSTSEAEPIFADARTLNVVRKSHVEARYARELLVVCH